MPAAAKVLIQQVAGSIAVATFAFSFFLYGYCIQFRPRQPMPEMGLDHPVNFKGHRLVYVSAFESLCFNSFFYWIAVLIIVAILSRSTTGRMLQYDVRRGKIAWAPADERIGRRRVAILVGLWLAVLVVAWRASL